MATCGFAGEVEKADEGFEVCRNRLVPLSGINANTPYLWRLPFLPEELTPEQDIAWCHLIGFVLGFAGMQVDDLPSSEKRVVIHQKRPEGNEWLREQMRVLGIKWQEDVSSDGVIRFTCYNPGMHDFFKAVYDGNPKQPHDASRGLIEGDRKALQQSLYWPWKADLSAGQARGIIAGWVAADGGFKSIGTEHMTGYTSSVSLRDDMAFLGAMCNASVSVGVKTLAGEIYPIGSSSPARNAARWFVSFLFTSAPGHSIATCSLPKPVEIDVATLPVGCDRVYSLSVPNTTYYARRHGVNSRGQEASKSFFTGNSMRAIRARYHPMMQSKSRTDQLKGLGHSVDKVEFIVMGGTFMSLPEDYRDFFIRNLHDSLSGHTSQTVDEAVRFSEQSNTKCIGITIETRPDFCLKPHLSQLLRYGCTRLEIGVQSVYEDVARDTNRGHTVKAVSESFQMSKDAGFKVVSHMMPDLPNMGLERDIEQFIELFSSPAFRPDGLKIYPTLVIRGTGLYELWRTGRYKNYSPEVLVDLVARILALVPPWTRIYRVQRDIPMPLVSSGVEKGNLRELALSRMKDLGTSCRDVRTREVGIVDIHTKVRPDEVELIRRDYVANGGWETFLSYEDPQKDILIGLLRLRKCSEDTFRPELKTVPSSIVRELHVYGSVVPIHSRDPKKFQHQGFGTLLMEEAERIAREEHGSQKLAVISGVGTRYYYRKLGYELDGPYMSKMLV